MKKIMSLVMLLLVYCCSLGGGISRGEAANWVEIFATGGEDGYKVYIDTDSFKYNAGENVIQCWQKLHSKSGNSDLMTYDSFNLNDDSAANKSIVKYVNGENKGSYNKPYLKYSPIVPDTIQDRIYSVLKYIKKVQESNVEWEFNDRGYFKPSPIDEAYWKVDEETGAVYDEGSKREFNDTCTYWGGKPPFIFCCEADYKTGKVATIAFQLGIGEDTVAVLHLPVLIWIDEQNSNGLAKQLHDEQIQVILRYNM